MANVENLATHWFPLFQPYFLGVGLSIGGRIPLDSPSDLGILKGKTSPFRRLENLGVDDHLPGDFPVAGSEASGGAPWVFLEQNSPQNSPSLGDALSLLG